MNLLLSRILTYLNGSLVDDCYYRFCKFVVYNYLEFEILLHDGILMLELYLELPFPLVF